MLKFICIFCLALPLSARASTDAQAFFMATAKMYNQQLTKKVWIKKSSAKISSEDATLLAQELAGFSDDQLLSAVQKDRSTVNLVDEGQTFATLKVGDSGQLILNGQPLEMKSLATLREKIDYLKGLSLPKVKDANRAQVNLSVLKFSQVYGEGLGASQLEGAVKELTSPFEVKRLDLSCQALDEEVPGYLKKVYRSGANSEIFRDGDYFAVRRLSLHLLDEYEDTYEEKMDVVIKAKPQITYTKPNKKAAKKKSEVYVFDIWKNGSLVKKNVLLKNNPTADGEIQKAREILTCCQSQVFKGSPTSVEPASCADSAAAPAGE